MTKRDLENLLREAKAKADTMMQRYYNLDKQVQADVRQSDTYKAIIREAEAERKLAAVTNENYVFLSGKVSHLEQENRKLAAGIMPGTYTGADHAIVERLEAENARLKGENEGLRIQLEAMKQLLANDGSSPISKTEQSTERFAVVPNARKRGRKPKADPEIRQYIHELYKITDINGKRQNSMGSISNLVGLSKTQVFAIINEPEQPGKWYSEDHGNRVYYDSYSEAYRASIANGLSIHFQLLPNE